MASIVVNNHFDIEFFRILCTNPGLAREPTEHPLFDCVGHSYEIAYGNMVHILASTLEESFSILPDPRDWESEFAALRLRKKRGYYWRSDVSIPPVGAYQYSKAKPGLDNCSICISPHEEDSCGRRSSLDSRGFLKGVYGEAFGHFLRMARLDWPLSIDDPVVALSARRL